VIYIFVIKEKAGFKPRKVYLNKGSNMRINIVALSPNPYCRGKAILIAFSGRRSVDLVIQYRKFMRSIILSHVACLAVIFFSQYLINTLFVIEIIEHKTVFRPSNRLKLFSF